MTPLFFVETLGDLDLGEHKSGKPITKVISELSNKVPENALPNVHHLRLLIGDLLGHLVEMDGRPIIGGGEEKVDTEGNVGVFFNESAEQIALRRWFNGEFYDIERLFSKVWRDALSNSSFENTLGIVKNIVPAEMRFSNSSQVLVFVDNFIKTTKIDLLLYLTFELSGLPQKFYKTVLNRWNSCNYPNLYSFAPYAAYILKLDLFFYVCMLKGLESKERPSHKTDLAYLYYLPFCYVFVSNDKLHKRIAPLFLRNDQQFVAGDELKKGFAELNTYYEKYIDQINQRGFISFAPRPPLEFKNKVSDIWDHAFPDWRNSQSKDNVTEFPKKGGKLLDHLKNTWDNSVKSDTNTPMDQIHHVMSSHKVLLQKGKWRTLPKGIENDEKG